MDTPSLQTVLEVLRKKFFGLEEVDPEIIVKYEQLLRESEVLGEEENGNVYVMRYSGDNQLYAVRNINMGPLTYISTYDEYYETRINQEDN